MKLSFESCPPFPYRHPSKPIPSKTTDEISSAYKLLLDLELTVANAISSPVRSCCQPRCCWFRQLQGLRAHGAQPSPSHILIPFSETGSRNSRLPPICFFRCQRWKGIFLNALLDQRRTHSRGQNGPFGIGYCCLRPKEGFIYPLPISPWMPAGCKWQNAVRLSSKEMKFISCLYFDNRPQRWFVGSLGCAFRFLLLFLCLLLKTSMMTFKKRGKRRRRIQWQRTVTLA